MLRPIAREILRAIRPQVRLTLDGKSYVVPFEARRLRQDRDFEVIARLAAGKRCVYDVGLTSG